MRRLDPAKEQQRNLFPKPGEDSGRDELHMALFTADPTDDFQSPEIAPGVMKPPRPHCGRGRPSLSKPGEDSGRDELHPCCHRGGYFARFQSPERTPGVMSGIRRLKPSLARYLSKPGEGSGRDEAGCGNCNSRVSSFQSPDSFLGMMREVTPADRDAARSFQSPGRSWA